MLNKKTRLHNICLLSDVVESSASVSTNLYQLQSMDAVNAERSTHLALLQEAIEEARKCKAVPGAFSVGCVIVTRWPELHSPPTRISAGYSRELPGNTHAEANALTKLDALSVTYLEQLFGEHPPQTKEILRNADVYTTMEPCSIRTSGLAPCADALIKANVRRCFIGTAEPADFVVCEGAKKMAESGIEIVWLEELADSCLAIARTRESQSQA